MIKPQQLKAQNTQVLQTITYAIYAYNSKTAEQTQRLKYGDLEIVLKNEHFEFVCKGGAVISNIKEILFMNSKIKGITDDITSIPPEEQRYYALNAFPKVLKIGRFNLNEEFIEGFLNDIMKKADKEYVDSELMKKANLVYVDSELNKKADKEYVDSELNKKADKTYVDSELMKKANLVYVDSELNKKADKEYVDSELNKKADKTYVDSELMKKANLVYVDSELNKKADKEYVDSELNKKADKTYVDEKDNEIYEKIKERVEWYHKWTLKTFKFKADTGWVSGCLDLKADKTYVNDELNKKADKTYVDSELMKKANLVYVDSELNKKADKEYVDSELNKKADKTYVDEKDNEIYEKIKERVEWYHKWTLKTFKFKADTGWVSGCLDLKADKTYVNDELNKKADKTYVNEIYQSLIGTTKNIETIVGDVSIYEENKYFRWEFVHSLKNGIRYKLIPKNNNEMYVGYIKNNGTQVKVPLDNNCYLNLYGDEQKKYLRVYEMVDMTLADPALAPYYYDYGDDDRTPH
ncbi:hypothetical protein TVAGG3_0088090, partial [Trichomonas vaginalis G3]|uniref:hypothetical protein n=1 Tax=Trichomonas vaginalis (strain ATCC PRA-98 / G3) TaxID=412133 RepID=UPI0021E5D224